MTSSFSTSARQREYPVVALTYEADLRLCRALVQALSEKAPSHLYRINPKPYPPQTFDLRLEISETGAAQLVWPGGKGETVSRSGCKETEFDSHIVAASPSLPATLNGSRWPVFE